MTFTNSEKAELRKAVDQRMTMLREAHRHAEDADKITIGDCMAVLTNAASKLGVK